RAHTPLSLSLSYPLFFFPGSPTPALSPLSLHDALPISVRLRRVAVLRHHGGGDERRHAGLAHRQHVRARADRREETDEDMLAVRSEEHTSELQSLAYLVCRLLLEKKKNTIAQRSCMRLA